MVIKNVYMFINTHFYFRIVKEKINLIESRPLLQVSRPKDNAKRKTPTTWALHGITVSSNSDNTVQHVWLNKSTCLSALFENSSLCQTGFRNVLLIY